jgi:hypothetical protein
LNKLKTTEKEDAMRSIKLFTILSAFLMIMGVVVTEVEADTWYLNTSNVNLGVSGNFASVTINAGSGVANFEIAANLSIFTPGDNFGIDMFFFNTTLSDITTDDFVVADGWTVRTSRNASSFGEFEFLYKGTGDSRINPLTFSINDPSILSPLNFYEENDPGGFHFAAHIAGFTNLNGRTSAFFGDGGNGAPVPEPGTIVLLGAGLLGLGLFGRKRMKG